MSLTAGTRIGQQRSLTNTIRRFSDLEGLYKDRWDLLGLKKVEE